MTPPIGARATLRPRTSIENKVIRINRHHNADVLHKCSMPITLPLERYAEKQRLLTVRTRRR
jgi:hypothetical protein